MKRFLITIATVLLFAQSGWAAVAFDAKSGGGLTGAASITVAHTTTGSDRLLTVCMFTIDDSAVTHDTVTYNGVGMTKIGDEASGSIAARLSMWQLVAPATGANNIVATPSSPVNIQITAASWTGVNQATPLGTLVETAWAVTTGPASVVVGSAVGDLVIDCFGTHMDVQARPVAGSGQTIRASWGGFNAAENPATDETWTLISSEAGASPTVTMTYDWDASSEHTSIMGVSIKPLATSVRRRPVVVMQ